MTTMQQALLRAGLATKEEVQEQEVKQRKKDEREITYGKKRAKESPKTIVSLKDQPN